jgi:hypothetical protein
MASLTEYMKKQVNPDDETLVGSTVTPLIRGTSGAARALVTGADNPLTFTGLPQAAMSNVVRAIGTGISNAIRPAPANPLALAPGESVVQPTALAPVVTAPVVTTPPATVPVTSDTGALSQFSTPEQAAIKADAAKSGAGQYNVTYQAPRAVGGVRSRPAPVMQQAEEAPVEQQAPSGLEAYMARTGINIPARPLLSATSAGTPERFMFAHGADIAAPSTGDVSSDYVASQERAKAADAVQSAQWQAYLASPEGKAEEAARAAMQAPGGFVEVVRGDKTSFENFTPGAPNPALNDYLFGLKQKEQLQKDYASAVAKPVGANLTLGETEALKATDRALQEQGSLGVAGIGAGAHIRAAEIGAAAGKNPLYEAAAEDIANTPVAERTAKLQQYLGGKTATTKADPMDKVYAEQLFMPEEQQAYAGLRALGEPPAAAFAAVREKFGAKK